MKIFRKLTIIFISISFLSCTGSFSLFKNKNLDDVSKTNIKTSNLSKSEIDTLVLNNSINGFLPIKKNAELLIERMDFDNDGLMEVLAFYVDTSNKKIANYEYLSNTSRLYSAESKAYNYKLLVYSLEKNGISLKKEINLGKKKLLESIINRNSNPGIVEVLFQTLRHTEHFFISFNAELDESIFVINEGPSFFSKQEDINNDGFLDIITYEAGFEDGIGGELFATWYNWTGDKYLEKKSVALIRSLNKFLSDSKNFLLNEDYDKFVSFALNRELSGNSPELINNIFKATSQNISSYDNSFISSDKIIDIIIPEILENPFDLEHDEALFFEITVKMISEKESILYRSKVFLNRNPFSEKIFYFSLD